MAYWCCACVSASDRQSLQSVHENFSRCVNIVNEIFLSNGVDDDFELERAHGIAQPGVEIAVAGRRAEIGSVKKSGRLKLLRKGHDVLTARSHTIQKDRRTDGRTAHVTGREPAHIDHVSHARTQKHAIASARRLVAPGCPRRACAASVRCSLIRHRTGGVSRFQCSCAQN